MAANMSQRIAVVTGSNKGIGFAIVRALCKQLDNGVVYLTSRNEERGKEAVSKLNQEGLQPKYHQLDITDQASINKLRDHLSATHGGLDVLVNNAAIAFKQNATDAFGVQASVSMETNFTATLEISRALIPIMRPGGRIVNIASFVGPMVYKKMSKTLQASFQIVKTEQDVEQLMKEFVDLASAGTLASKGWPEMAYGTTKLGVIALTRVQAAKLLKDKPDDDILLMCCCPGYVDTDMSSHKGPKTIDQGADTAVYLALLPPGSADFSGNFFSDRARQDFL